MNYICSCVEVKYLAAHDNYYCVNCKRGMGLAYYHLAKQLESLYVVTEPDGLVGVFSTLEKAAEEANPHPICEVYKGGVDEKFRELKREATEYTITYFPDDKTQKSQIFIHTEDYKGFMQRYAESLTMCGLGWVNDFECVLWTLTPNGDVNRNFARILIRPSKWKYNES